MQKDVHGITLAEVLVVIAIIAVLASLMVRAIRRPLVPANRPAITLELHNLGGAIRDFQMKYGAYPPNASHNSMQTKRSIAIRTPLDAMHRMFKKAFPRHREPETLMDALVGLSDEAGSVTSVEGGISPSEAIFFWLGGFSEDSQYPISGYGGPSFSDAEGNADGVLDADDEDLLSREMRYQFEHRRLGPRTSGGKFDDRGSNRPRGRFIEYDDPRDGTRRRINFWRYCPENSEVAIVYFDTSRYAPQKYYPAIHPESESNVGPLLQLREKAGTTDTSNEHLVFVEDGKFQLLHAGPDGEWGDWSAIRSGEIVAPTGPFVGEIADTLGHFMPGTLEDKQE